MASLLAIWLVIGVATMLIGASKGRTAGMPLAYFLLLSLIHAPGAAVYIDFPDWAELTVRTKLGFEQTVVGLAAFLVAVVAIRSVTLRNRLAKVAEWRADSLAKLDRIALFYLCAGSSYFALGALASVPSVGALVASLSYFLVVGASLRLWVASQENRRVKFWLSIALLPILPLVTIVRSGFIGFGTYWLMSIVCFAFAQDKRRLGSFIVAPFMIFIGLSVFVNYMASRVEIRRAVWVEQSGIGDRLQRVTNIFTNFEWFDGENPKHRDVVDGRLNQNILVGAAVERLRSGIVEYAHGATFAEMIVGLIPRAVWPEKPQVGGGGTVVQDYSAIKAADGTSVGAGQVLEFYVNFGTIGVICGFLIYGLLVGWMDMRTADSLAQGDQKAFMLWYMVCLALLQPGGNLLEVVVSAAGCAVTSLGIGYLFDRHLNSKAFSQTILPPLAHRTRVLLERLNTMYPT